MQQPVQDAVEWRIPVDGSMYDDPLLDCLVLLAHHHGRSISHESIRAGLPIGEDGLSPDLFSRAAQRAGFSARILKRRLSKLDDLFLPVILFLSDHQACVLLELDHKENKARLIDPESGSGEEWVSLDRLESRYIGYTIFMRPEHHFDQRTDEIFKLRSRNWFWGVLFKSWLIYRDVLAASFLVNVFALASPLFVMNVYDRVVPNNAFETLGVLTVGVAIIFGFDLLIRSLRGYFIDLAGKKAEITLSAAIFEQVMGLKMSNRPKSAGAFSSNLKEFDGVREFITSATITTLIDLPFVFLFLAVIWFIGGPIVWVPAAGIPIIILYSLFIQPSLKRAVENTFRMSAQRNATLVESLIGMESIKTLGAEGQMQGKWEQAVAHISNWAIRTRMLSMSAVNVSIAVQHFVTVGTVFFGVYLVSEGQLSLGGLIACVILAGRTLAPMGQVASLSSKYNQAKAALKTLQGIMDLPQERPENKTFVHRPTLEGGIEFNDVTFTYPGQTLPALEKLSFKIGPGEKVGIVGRIGSGKTTLQKLVMGLYEPDSGTITIDGVDVHQIDPADLRRNIGYVAQDNMLFYGSVKDNITTGVPYVDDAMILNVAKIAGVSEFVDSHPSGFDLDVGERGVNLSGGQRQAVAIARALILNPPLLLFDEPTNEMDNSTEESIKRRLSEGVLENKTLLLVTHRASLSDLVDRIIVIDRGRVIADGPKSQIMSALKGKKVNITKPL
ncbi:type I secretion system permease/ATPase [Solemya velesiana gill symbiont]|uniref:ABC transporter n=1 Tax=Solemya velesiana gill symbiont TaxID=1918948 RepID=A0A1T2KSZ5_9GAMM|nr:type I secretion system permease/ATPase [Solemya velesiana gill symbiont]OOZ35977.1 ABC transporter [Solemya velesiana gill symbiont]